MFKNHCLGSNLISHLHGTFPLPAESSAFSTHAPFHVVERQVGILESKPPLDGGEIWDRIDILLLWAGEENVAALVCGTWDKKKKKGDNFVLFSQGF